MAVRPLKVIQVAMRAKIASARLPNLLLQVNMVLLLQMLKLLSNCVRDKPDKCRGKRGQIR